MALQLPGPEPDAGSRLRRGRALGTQGDRGRRGDRRDGRAGPRAATTSAPVSLGMDDASGIDFLRRSRELALEHHLPDEVGRANTNLASQGGRIFPMPIRGDGPVTSSRAPSTRGARSPDGIFDRWIRTARSEFLMISARWEEAEPGPVSALTRRSSEAYLSSEILSMRGLLYAYRGRFDEAAEITADVADTALRIGDLQAVIPALADAVRHQDRHSRTTPARSRACGRRSSGAATSRRPSSAPGSPSKRPMA